MSAVQPAYGVFLGRKALAVLWAFLIFVRFIPLSYFWSLSASLGWSESSTIETVMLVI